MSSNLELLLVFGGLHLFGLSLAGVLFLFFVRSDRSAQLADQRDDGDDDGGGGGSDRLQPRNPAGPQGYGPPLPDAIPASIRLRSEDRLADHIPPPDRRPSHPQPERSPVPLTRDY